MNDYDTNWTKTDLGSNCSKLSREETCNGDNRSVNAIINDTASVMGDINGMLDRIIACISRDDACNQKDELRVSRDDIIGTAMLNLESAFEGRAKLEMIYKLLGV